jgi:predicted ATPase
VEVHLDDGVPNAFPFDISAIRALAERGALTFHPMVGCLVGENGTATKSDQPSTNGTA